MHPSTARRGDGDFAAIAAERDAASIPLHRQFVGERGLRQNRGISHSVQSQQWRRDTELALPLHGEADKAVVPHRQVPDGVLMKFRLELYLFVGEWAKLGG
jgi:hypothetical protein